MTRRQLALLALFTLGLGAAAWAFSAALEQSQEHELPSAQFFALAFLLVLISLSCAARGWVALFAGAGDRATLAGGLYASQLAKYVPGGGAMQVAGQVALARDVEISLTRASMAYPVFALVTVASGTTIAAGLAAVDSALPPWARLLALAGLVSPAVLFRGLSRGLIDQARRLVKRIPSSDLLPPQQAIWRTYAWALPMMLATSAAFALMLHPLEPEAGLATTTVAFAAAWVIGFLVLPIPAGLGIREGALLVILSGSVAPGALLAASLAHRMVTILAEIVMIGLNRAHRRWYPTDR